MGPKELILPCVEKSLCKLAESQCYFGTLDRHCMIQKN